ncbi:presenilin family intramembrane aspartyl protease PSH [Natrononativus amylolyticus]|uniref:presenilin family intramembrane aspartyl protease PSH n=1 Tax=Natrononativus amylolyticus TaxID=2963434 RepID=UPI0020CD9718|nr:presenilin family intramembrane aspartyl protease PSH [Natrononativus amylolyticus]
MNDRARVLAAVGVTVLLFLGVQLGALALIEPFHDADRQAVENPEDPTNSVVYFVAILLATGFMLAAFKYDVQWLIRGLIIGVSVFLAWFVFAEILPPLIVVGGLNALALGGALLVGLGLLVYPEWYVIDTAGVVMGAGAAGLFGISFGLLPALVLLVVLAVYDAISVYKTKHMLSLAEGVMDLKIPVVLVVPTTLSYSYLEAMDADPDAEREGGIESPEDAGLEGGQRDALFIGLGDAVIPTILVASAAYFVDAGTLDVPGIVLNVPALGALLGTIAGLLVLMHMVLKGRPHAGLPLLNGGAIAGYLLGALASGVSLTGAIGL